jgi:peptidoglycan/xylan/chitin deacetylase (PgdA/CDA1 family)
MTYYYTNKISSKSNIKNIVMKCMALLGFNWLARIFTANKPKIIMFHKVYLEGKKDLYSDYINEYLFEEIIVYCKKNYQLYTLGELFAYYRDFGRYPKNAVVLTFDDGFQSFYYLAYPLLKKYTVKASIFVCPGLIDKDNTLWPEVIYDAYEKAALGLNSAEIMPLIDELKNLDQDQRDQKMKALISDEYHYQEELADMNRALMNWPQLREINESGLVEVGSHSLTHPILSRETQEKVNSEMRLSKERIESELENKVVSFCYPNGQSEDYRETEVIELKKCGYKVAVTSEFGLVTVDSKKYLLPRFGGDFDNLLQAKKYIDGLEYFQRKFSERN